jgi:hypothetical protein
MHQADKLSSLCLLQPRKEIIERHSLLSHERMNVSPNPLA